MDLLEIRLSFDLQISFPLFCFSLEYYICLYNVSILIVIEQNKMVHDIVIIDNILITF